MAQISSAFIENSQLQFAWDSTSLGLLKTCPRKYYYKMVEQWRSKHEALALSYGIAYHSALENYDKIKADGGTHEEGVVEATKICLACRFPEDPKNIRTRFTLVRSVVWYLEQFKEDACKTLILKNGKPAVELSFKMELPLSSPNGEKFILCGHLDRVVIFNDKLWVMDRKTTGSSLGDNYFSNFNPDNQMSLYTFATRIVTGEPVSGIIIDAAQLAVGFTRFQRHITNRTEGQINEWLGDTLSYIEQAKHFSEREYWPMNDSSCSKYGGCEFKGVCSKDASVRKIFLEADFERHIWNPMEER